MMRISQLQILSQNANFAQLFAWIMKIQIFVNIRFAFKMQNSHILVIIALRCKVPLKRGNYNTWNWGFFSFSGTVRLLTHWEQLDHGLQYTPTRKFLTIIPILLFFLASFYTHYQSTHFLLNSISLAFVLVRIHLKFGPNYLGAVLWGALLGTCIVGTLIILFNALTQHFSNTGTGSGNSMLKVLSGTRKFYKIKKN
jgi:hypothetical protein